MKHSTVSAFPLLAALVFGIVASLAASTAPRAAEPTNLHQVIVELEMPQSQTQAKLAPAIAARAQKLRVSLTQDAFMDKMADTPSDKMRVHRRMRNVPFVAMEVDDAELARLLASNGVRKVYRDREFHTSLAESTPLIGAPAVFRSGFEGSGQVVAVLDTGVESSHPFLRNKVVAEACFSTGSGSYTSFCPNGGPTQTGTDAARPCASGCSHGTHVAGIVAGRGTSSTGVAPAAGILAIQVFRRHTSSGGVTARESDIIAALDHVLSLKDQFNIAAVNMSLGGGRFGSTCDGEAEKPIIDRLRAAGIATVVATGNDGYKDSISSPACISSAVSVGSTTKRDTVSSFSNSAQFVTLLAPGSDINSSITNGRFDSFNGTSMATPHVAGAFALLRSAVPGATVDQLITALRETGVGVRDSNGITKPRINVERAVAALGAGGGGGGAMSVTPAATFSVSGPPGGAFSPASQQYTVRNNTGATITYRAATSADWLSVSPASGSLSNGATATVTARITSAANALEAGIYVSSVSFTNATNGRGDTSRTVNLSIRTQSGGNDKFAEALRIGAASGSTTANNTNAGREEGEPEHADDPGGGSLWWRWRAPAPGKLTVDTVGSSLDTLLAVYRQGSRSGVANLDLQAENDDIVNGQNRASRVEIDVLKDIDYFIAVDGWDNNRGDITLNLDFKVSENAIDQLAVTPVEEQVFAGSGTRYSPASAEYTLNNVFQTTITVDLRALPPWLQASRDLVTLGPAQSATVTLRPSAFASTLSPGSYRKEVPFTVGDNIAAVRAFELQVAGGNNDRFASAAVIGSTPATVNGTNLDATRETGEPDHDSVSGGKSVWWRWRAPADRSHRFTTVGSSYDTVLAVYTGSAVNGLSRVASNDDGDGIGRASEVTFATQRGVDYYIAVDGYEGATGAIELCVTTSTGSCPEGSGSGSGNDDFVDSVTLDGAKARGTGSNRSATKESGEDNHASDDGGRSVWWRWTAPATGEVTLDTLGSDYDTLLAVYTGTRVSSLGEVASNDDIKLGVERQSRLSFMARKGTEYQIAVDGWCCASATPNTPENGLINLNLRQPIANDSFSRAVTLGGGLPRASGNTTGATREPNEPDHGDAAGGSSLWWRWTAASTRTVNLAVEADGFAPVLGVYTGTSLDSLSVPPGLSRPDGAVNRASFAVVAGRTYYLAIDGRNGATGAFRLGPDSAGAALSIIPTLLLILDDD